MVEELTLPKQTLDFINSYFQLPIANKKIRCPYYKNKRLGKKKFEKRVLIGKGHPQEIALTVELLAKNSNRSLKNWPVKKIRNFMKKNEIGIDCSGFVSWILDSWYQEEFKGRHIWRKIKFSSSFLKRFRYFLRPVENLDVETLLNCQDCKPVLKPIQINPGDLIHLGQHHLLLVYRVTKDTEGRTRTIFYCHSSNFYDGVHRGKIKVEHPNSGLEDQSWIEEEGSKNWSFTEYLHSDKSGVIRLEIFQNK